MTKFHINKHGIPTPCRAKKGNCPLGGDDNHFDNKEDAQEYVDKKNAAEFGILPSDKTHMDKELQDAFNYFNSSEVDNSYDENFFVYLDKEEWEFQYSHIDRHEDIMKEFENHFNEGDLIMETKDENEVIDTLAIENPGFQEAYEMLAEELKSEGYHSELLDIHGVYGGNNYKTDKEFREKFREFLKEHQSEPAEVGGKKYVSVIPAEDERTKEFFIKEMKDRAKVRK